MENENKTLPHTKSNSKTETVSKAKHYFYIVASIFSAFVFIQNWFLNEKIDTIKDEQNAQDAWKQVAMKDVSRKLETAYLQLKQKESKYIEHCKSHPCQLPIELMVSEADIKYDSIESIMAGNIDREKYKK